MSGMLFDAHCDTAFRLQMTGEPLLENSGHVDLIRCGAYAPHARFFAIFPMSGEEVPGQPPAFRGMDWQQMARQQLQLLLEQIRCNGDRVCLCRTAADADAAAGEGKLAAFLSLEGAEGAGCSCEGLEWFYESGVRAVNPVWNRDNALCGSCATGHDLGLTEQGRAFVRRAEQLGMILDVSHSSERGFWDLCRTVDGPFMASHSNAKALCGHPRNLTDRQFRELCRRGGVAGLNLYAPFLHDSGRATVEDAARHVLHFLELGGEDHIAIGTDFDGCDRLPEGVGGIQDLALLTRALRAQGVDEKILEKIYYKNLFRLVGEVCDI